MGAPTSSIGVNTQRSKQLNRSCIHLILRNRIGPLGDFFNKGDRFTIFIAHGLGRQTVSTSLQNFLLSNGQALWTHASTKLYYIVREHPFPEVQLKDEDVKVDLADLNGPDDRLAIVVTEPLTTNETWTPLASGQLMTFVNGSPLPLTAPLTALAA